MLDDEHRRVGVEGAVEAAGGFVVRVRGSRRRAPPQETPQVETGRGGVRGALSDCRGIQDLPQIDPQEPLQQLARAVDLGAERGLRRVEPRRHVEVLVAEAGEEEGDARRGLFPLPAEHPFGGGVGEQGDGLVAVAADQRAAVAEGLPSPLQGMGDVGEVELRVLPQMAPEVAGGGVERRGAARREQEELVRARRGGRRRQHGRLLEDDMGVGAAEAEGAHPGPARRAVARPGFQLGVDVERARREVDLRVGPLEVQARRDHAVLEGEGGLDQPGGPGRRGEVSEVGLHRAQPAELPPAVRLALERTAERAGQRLDLDRVADRRPRAVRLDVGDLLRLDAAPRQRLGDHLRLPLDGRSGVPHLEGAVVVDRRPLDHRADRVAVRQRVGEPLEHHHPQAAADEGALSAGVEGPAAAVGRQDPSLLVDVAPQLQDVHRGAAGERHVALLRQQALAGGVHRDEPRRAGALDVEARPGQVQLVGDPGRHVVAGIAQLEAERIEGRQRRRIGQELIEQVGAGRDAGEDAGRAGVGLPHVAGVLERLPGALEEEALLGVHDLGLAVAEAEEAGVEAVDAARHRDHLDQVGMGELVRIDPRRAQLLVAQRTGGVDAVPQVPPQLGRILGRGEPAGHADDGDIRFIRFVGLIPRRIHLPSTSP